MIFEFDRFLGSAAWFFANDDVHDLSLRIEPKRGSRNGEYDISVGVYVEHRNKPYRKSFDFVGFEEDAVFGKFIKAYKAWTADNKQAVEATAETVFELLRTAEVELPD